MCGVSGLLHVPGGCPVRGPYLGYQHISSGQKEAGATPLHTNSKEKPSRGEAADVLLLNHHRTSADVLCVCLVLAQLRKRWPCCPGLLKKSLFALYPPWITSRCIARANKILKNGSYPGQLFYQLLPLGRRYRSHRATEKQFLPMVHEAPQ